MTLPVVFDGSNPLGSLSEFSLNEAEDALLALRGGIDGAPLRRIPRTDLDQDAKDLIVAACARTGRPHAIAEALGYSPLAFAAALKSDSVFAQSIAAARARRVEDMEAAVDVRAFHGIKETRVSKDGDVTERLVFSDKLAELRLKAEAPDKYADRQKIDVTARAAVLIAPAVPASSADWLASHSASSTPAHDQADALELEAACEEAGD